MSTSKYKELLFIKELNGVGPVRINTFYLPLLQQGADIEQLKQIALENEKKVDDENIAAAFKKAEEIYAQVINREDMRVCTILDDDYPSKLKALKNKAPVILYVKGDISLSEKDSIAVIGTREPGSWSEKVEEQLVGKILELTDRVIVSGLAVGCDTIAHRACVKKKGKTIAMLPCGFDHISPEENIGLSKEILESGGVLISEYLPYEEATTYTFVERDTLIAAISDAVMVIECGKKSGTMHAVNAAIDLNRKVGAFSTDNKEQGNYEGNEYIITEKGGFPISDSKTLKDFLDMAAITDTEEPVQMSLFDL